MVDVTVTQLAKTIEIPVDRLLQQLQEAGLPPKNIDDSVSENEKQRLLTYIKGVHGAGAAPKKITLKRRTLSTLKASNTSSRSRTVNVEVRKKRTYMRKIGASEAKNIAADQPDITETKPTNNKEALRRAAHIELEVEAERRRQEAALKTKQEAEQLAKKQAEIKAKQQTEAEKQKQLEESKVSARKDKRDRHDLDDTDVKVKRAKHGNRKHRLEAQVEEEVDELIDVETMSKGATLGLTKNRSKRTTKPISPQHQFKAPTQEIHREVEIGATITVAQLSQRMSIKATEVIKTLMNLSVMANINQAIDQDTAMLVVEECGHTVKILDADTIEKSLEAEMTLTGDRKPRSPVVTVMGHVDHGKTSLLDYIRNARVASGEAGGITQHIGAYRVTTSQGEICFIDTPGHAAFTAMRARGANCTDIVILVVAADDGVMPQTEEAIQHTKDALVPMVVAINKIDKEGADPEQVKQELAGKEVIPDDWGGDTQFIPVSALTGQGIEDLLEAVLLQAELLELTAVEDGPANGVVIEAELDKGKGPVTTLLVQNGILKQGDVIVAGQQHGRTRVITDDKSKPIKSAGPATPVMVLGLDGTPSAGDTFVVVRDEKRAREVAEFRKAKADSERLTTSSANLTNLLANFGSSEVNYLNIVIKADMQGSLEAIVSALSELGNEEVRVSVTYSGVGGIAEHDVNFAITTGSVIFGFNVRADSAARKLVENEKLDLRYYKVIYHLVDDIKAALSGMLSPEVREKIIGLAEVRDVFQSKKFGNIAGCMVIEGMLYKDKKIRVLRDNIVIYEGELESLRHFKDEVESVRNGTECGIGVKNYNDVKVGDQIEVFDAQEVARAL